MIDRKMEDDITDVKNFLEFWGKFHAIYSEVISRERISEEDDLRFSETREMIRSKYKDLRESLEIRYAPHGRITDPVNDVLEVGTVHHISEKKMKKLSDDWKDSYVFLNNILENLKSRAKVSRDMKPPFAFLKRILTLR